MKRIAASIGLVAIGSTVIQQANAVSLSPQEKTKPWSVGVALRGFYDDNYLLAERGDDARVNESFGFSVSPTVSLNLPLEQTYLGLDLGYGGSWYEDDSHYDQSFNADAQLNHAFNDRTFLDVTDGFLYSDREQVDGNNPLLLARTDQSSLRNELDVEFTYGLSSRFSVTAGYGNRWYDYDQEGVGSLSAVLDRVENQGTLRLQHRTAPSTTTELGYSFTDVSRPDDEQIFVGVDSDVRNTRGHLGYVGVDHVFSPLFTGGLQLGVQYTDFYNNSQNDGQLTPYGNAHVSYFYTSGSSVTAGYRLSQAATDLVGSGANGDYTQNRTASTLWTKLNHSFSPDFRGSLTAQWTYSEYNGGSYDGLSENLYLLGAKLQYDINPFLSADLGYSFDYSDADPGLRFYSTTAGVVPSTGYTRNLVYIGLTAKY